MDAAISCNLPTESPSTGSHHTRLGILLNDGDEVRSEWPRRIDHARWKVEGVEMGRWSRSMAFLAAALEYADVVAEAVEVGSLELW